MGRRVTWLVLGGFFCSAMSGCGTAPQTPYPSPAQAEVDAVDAVDRVAATREPPSRTGNPPFYEVFGKRYHVQGSSEGYRERGHASWYGPKFHGKRTSSGTPFDMHALTAAHKSLPIPTYARVTHLDNGRSVVVRINDRGPFIDGRFIDLSYAAAVELDMIDSGVAPVEVVALPPYQYLPGFEPHQDALQLAASSTEAEISEMSAAHSEVATAPSSQPIESIQAVAYMPPSAASSSASPSPATASAASLYLQVGAFAQPYNAEQLQTQLTTLVEHPVHVHGDELYRVRIGPLADASEAYQLKEQLVALGFNPHRVVFE